MALYVFYSDGCVTLKCSFSMAVLNKLFARYIRAATVLELQSADHRRSEVPQ